MNTQPNQKPTTEDRALCAENWKEVCGRVDEACKKAGREPTSVRVIGVTKYVDIGTYHSALRCRVPRPW